MTQEAILTLVKKLRDKNKPWSKIAIEVNKSGVKAPRGNNYTAAGLNGIFLKKYPEMRVVKSYSRDKRKRTAVVEHIANGASVGKLDPLKMIGIVIETGKLSYEEKIAIIKSLTN